jgi:hypothetical protein
MFLKLHYIKTQIAKKKRSDPSEITSENSTTDEPNIPNIDDFGASGTLFEEANHQLRTVQNNMMAVLVKHVAVEFKMKSASYKKER